MYSFKEKNKLYYDLQNADFAQADLDLLCEISPAEQIIERAKRNPQRICNEVLYRLLDLKTAEEIRLNRRRATPSKDDAKDPADEAAAIAAKKAAALAKMAAGRAAKKAERDAIKSTGKTADPKTPKAPKVKAEVKKEEPAIGATPSVPTADNDTEKKK